MTAQVLTLRAIPLTPIHIGDGTELTPDSYVIRNKELPRFDPARVLADLDVGKRTLYLQNLDLGRLEDAQTILCNGVVGRHVTGRVAVSDASADELRPGAGAGYRSGRVHPFVRSGGKPFIPGSSIKGALRTALLDHFTKQNPGVKKQVDSASSWSARNVMSARHAALVRAAFNLTRDDTADDPLRFLSVADVSIPDNVTRIDPAIPGWRSQSSSHGRSSRQPQIQLHLERLRCAAESGTASPALTVTIAIDSDHQARLTNPGAPWRLPPAREMDWETLRRAANTFFWGRWQYEKQEFFPDGDSRDRLDVLLRQIPTSPGRRAVVTAGPGEGTVYLMLRLGRFSHFESLSVDNLREGDVPQRRTHRKQGEEGKNRTVTEIRFENQRQQKSRAMVPFGWLLLFRPAAR